MKLRLNKELDSLEDDFKCAIASTVFEDLKFRAKK